MSDSPTGPFVTVQYGYDADVIRIEQYPAKTSPKQESKMAYDKDTDGGWAWVVLVMTSLCYAIGNNMIIYAGLLQMEFLNYFSRSTGFTSLLSSIFIGLQLFLGPVSSVLCNVFSIRVALMTGGILFSLGLISASFTTNMTQLFITFSIIGGTGLGLTYSPHSVIIGHYFVRHRAVANGIVTSAGGVGYAVGPYITVWLLNNFGWRFALSILACSTLQVCVAGATCFPTNSEIINSRRQQKHPNSEITSQRKSRLCSNSRLWFLCHPHWWIFCIFFAFRLIAASIQIVHFPAFVESHNIPFQSITGLFTAFGITVSLSRILCGFLCSDDSIDLLVVLIGLQGLQGIAMVFMPLYAQTYTGLLLYQVVLSLFHGAAFVQITPLAIKLFGVDKLATVFGWVMMWGGLGSISGPFIAGWIYVVSLSYTLGFHIAGLFALASSSILLLIPGIKVKDETKTKDKTEMLIHEDQKIVINDDTDHYHDT